MISTSTQIAVCYTMVTIVNIITVCVCAVCTLKVVVEINKISIYTQQQQHEVQVLLLPYTWIIISPELCVCVIVLVAKCFRI